MQINHHILLRLLGLSIGRPINFWDIFPKFCFSVHESFVVLGVVLGRCSFLILGITVNIPKNLYHHGLILNAYNLGYNMCFEYACAEQRTSNSALSYVKKWP